MIRLMLFLFLATPALGQEIEMIDASGLSVADLIALAVEERENPSQLDCCDWGGGGCLAHLKSVAEMAATRVGPEE